MATLAKPEGTLQYDCDAFGDLARVGYAGRTVSYEYDLQGRLNRASSPEGVWTVAYNSAGRKSHVENLTEGLAEVYEYDALGRLLSIEHTRVGQADPLFKIEYTLGVDGNRLGTLETRGVDVTRWAYEYDLLGRLVRERRDVGDDSSWERDVGYEYDADSNRTRKIDYLDPTKSLTLYYEPGSHRLARIERGGVTHQSFTWTANGELATKTTVGTGTEKYAWGLDGTLASVLLPDGRKVVYGYDHQGQLISRKLYATASGTDPPLTDIRYLVDNENPTGYSQVLAEIDGKTGAVLRLNTFLDRLFAQTCPSQKLDRPAFVEVTEWHR